MPVHELSDSPVAVQTYDVTVIEGHEAGLVIHAMLYVGQPSDQVTRQTELDHFLTADEFQKLLDSPAYCRAFAEYARKLFGADKSAEAIAACAMQKQWARDLNRVRAVLEQFANSDNWVKDAMEDDWYWDGEGEPWQLAADALRGEE